MSIRRYIYCLLHEKKSLLKESRLYSWIIIFFFIFSIIFIEVIYYQNKQISRQKNDIVQKRELIAAQDNFLSLSGIGGNQKIYINDNTSLNVEWLIGNRNLELYGRSFEWLGYPVKEPSKTYLFLPECEFVARHDRYGSYWHTAVDFVSVASADLLALYSAMVTKVIYNDRIYGNFYEAEFVRNGEAWGFGASHLDSFNIELNQELKKGDIVGKIGNTGESLGDHCHLYLYKIVKGKRIYYNYTAKSLWGNFYTLYH